MSENVWPIVLKLAETWLQAKRHLAMDLAAGNDRLSIYLEQCCVSSMATGECLCVRVSVFVCAPAFFPIPSRISCPHQPHQHGRKGLGKILEPQSWDPLGGPQPQQNCQMTIKHKRKNCSVDASLFYFFVRE